MENKMKTDSPQRYRGTEDLAAGRVQLCSDKQIEIAGQVFRANKDTAYVEFELSHAFPVVTCDGTALHPQVVANSWRSMQGKVFDLNHMMRKYDPKSNKQDRMLGTVMAVEFPATGWQGDAKSDMRDAEGKWTVQGDKAKAPGIRAVACMHRAAELVDGILQNYFSRQIPWTVSMENQWMPGDSGFLIKSEKGKIKNGEKWEENTPEDLTALGWIYVPMAEAPDDLLALFDDEETKVKGKYHGREFVALLGGLSGSVNYCGVGLTPMGKEAEAEVVRMLAGKKMIEVDGTLLPDVTGLLRKTAEAFAEVISNVK